MNAITEARDELQAALEGLGVTVYTAEPDIVQPPALLVRAANPYVTPGLTYGGSFVVHAEVVVMTRYSGKLTALDELLAAVLAIKTGWRLTEQGADGPAIYADRPDLLTTVLTYSNTIYL